MSEDKKKVALICSRDTIEGAYPPLILAVNAVRLGYEATVFHTFMGMNMLRKGKAAKAKFRMPGLLGVIPGMAHLATWMMKRKIEAINIPTLKDLQEVAQLEGVKLVACQMTVDMMGLSESDLIDGIEIQTAEQYMKYAPSTDLTMFT